MMANRVPAELKILTPTGMLGYGYSLDEFWSGVEAGADAIVIDSGSTDNGPQELALGKRTCSQSAYLRDLEPMLEACVAHKIPILIGSAGGTGTNVQVDYMIDLIRSIARTRGFRLRVAAIYADVPKSVIRKRLQEGRVAPCGPVQELGEEDVAEAVNIVGQMGVEPFIKALEADPAPDIIVAGRAYDPAPYAALALRKGVDPGIAWHMGKIMECGGVCAEPKGGVIQARVRQDSFDLTPISSSRRCTPLSVAAHTLYEKTRADLLAGPGGVLDLRSATYESLDERTVRVKKSLFHRSSTYTVKLEGAKIVGYRTIFIGGVRDPILVGQVDSYLAAVRAYAMSHHEILRAGDAQLVFHVYGKNGVMGALEPIRNPTSHELCILAEVVGPTQEVANAICNTARIAALHAPYPNQLATGGNMAFPLTPLENEIGQVCAFNIYHLMEVDDPLELFPTRQMEI